METFTKEQLKEIGYYIKSGDEKAFHILYRSFFVRYVRYAERYTLDLDEAKNLVQNAYFLFWQHLSSYDPDKDIFLYILVIVKNNCLNYLRSLKIKDSHADKILEAMLCSGIEDNDIDEDLRLRLNELLESLPEKGRTALLKHIVDGKKVKDIALEMEIEVSTVKTHLKRSLKYMREHICLVF